MTHRRHIAGISLLALLIACDRGGGENSGNGPSGAATGQSGVTNPQAAVDTTTVGQLASARCDREVSCNNVGGGQKYASRQVCMDKLRGQIANDLNSYTCPGGFDSAGLSQCMAAIKNDECSHPFDTLKRIDKCRTDALCAKAK
jgi:hypothetical protein